MHLLRETGVRPNSTFDIVKDQLLTCYGLFRSDKDACLVVLHNEILTAGQVFPQRQWHRYDNTICMHWRNNQHLSIMSPSALISC